ncbi:MAG: periplasmic divalent cation tolerance protein [Desulfonauticus sp.]|jgi:periplasmic divalent cation tolerance protein|nr:periplasmic divalent cation tolerance protein [Desulfonauticus sp.]
MAEYVLGYITGADKKELSKIARTLLEERLIACANIFPEVISAYWWEGKIEEGQEQVMIIKTKANLMSRVVARVKELHSYSCPCVVFFQIKDGNPEFLQWIDTEVKGE